MCNCFKNVCFFYFEHSVFIVATNTISQKFLEVLTENLNDSTATRLSHNIFLTF